MRQCKEGADVPCIRITDAFQPEGRKIWYAKSVDILGPSKIVQTQFNEAEPNKPFIWIETDSDIEWS